MDTAPVNAILRIRVAWMGQIDVVRTCIEVIGGREGNRVPARLNAAAVEPVTGHPVDSRAQVFSRLAGTVEVTVHGQLAIERLRRIIGQAYQLATVRPTHRGWVRRHSVALLRTAIPHAPLTDGIYEVIGAVG